MQKKAVNKSAIVNRHQAILLLGPTGSGKSPLGDYLARSGLCGRRCFHFDFGANLRRVARKSEKPLFLNTSEFLTVKNVLKTGALLKDDEFCIADKILREYVRRKRVLKNDFLVLNGLPRHISQARTLNQSLNVMMVINLVCDESVVLSRIRCNSGGDRSGREDDSGAMVRKKLEIYRSRTLPLLDHYRRKRVKVINVVVTRNTSPCDVVDMINLLNA